MELVGHATRRVPRRALREADVLEGREVGQQVGALEDEGDDARRREVRQRIGGDIRADDGLPGHRAAQRVMNRCAEHRGRRRLVAAGLNVHTELREIRLRLDEHIEKMRNGRALITTDVRDARLQ